MSDQHGLQFNVDASGIAKGLSDYKSAVAGIFASLKQFEKAATDTFNTVSKAASNKSNLSAYAKSLSSFSNIQIDGTAARKISALSAALGNFKAPNATQASNLNTFFKSLSRLPDLSAAYASVKSISGLSSSLANFKAPSQAQAANLVAFSKALQAAAPGLSALKGVSGLGATTAELAILSTELKNIRPPSAGSITNLGNLALALKQFNTGNLSNAAHIGTALAGISGFRAPSPAQIRNLETFITAIGNLKAPPNVAAIVNSMNQIATAAAHANASLGGLRAGNSLFGGLSSGLNTAGRSAAGASHNFMGLENAFSASFQAGSVLRSLLGSLTIGELGRAFFEANQTANQFAATMEIISSSPGFQTQAWAGVVEMANKFGTDLNTTAQSFGQFAVAAHEAGTSFGQTKQIFEGFQTAMTAMHLGTQQQQSVGLALREMLDRGYVSTQQLTRQLGLVLPGAVVTLAKSVKEATLGQETLWDALKKKQVDSTQALLILSKYYTETFGPSVALALQSPVQQMNILKNHLTEFMIEIGNAGAKKGFADFIASITNSLDPKTMQALAQSISDNLVKALDALGNALTFVKEHWAEIASAASIAWRAFAVWGTLSVITGSFRMLSSGLLGATSMFRNFGLAMTTSSATAATTGASFAGLLAGTRPLSSGITNMSSTGLLAAANFRLMTSTSAGAGIGLKALSIGSGAATLGMNTLRVGVNAGKGALNGMMALFGGPWGVALIAAGSAVYYFASEWMKMSADVSTTHAMIARASEDMRQAALASQTAGTGLAGVGNYAAASTPLIKAFAGQVGDAAQQLYNMATASRAASLGKLQQDLVANRQQAGTLAGNTSSGADAAAHSDHGGNLLAFAGDVGHSLVASVKNVLTNGQSDAATRDAMKANDASARQMVAAIHTLIAVPLEKWAPQGLLPDSNKPLVGPGEPGKPKADKEFNALKSFETAWDEFMAKLEADDPITKIQSKFTLMLDSGAKLLLDKPAYTAAAGVIGDPKSSDAGRTKALQAAIAAGGLNKEATLALAKNGETGGDIIAALGESLRSEDEKIKEAIQKQFDNKYKGMLDVLKRLGEDDPVLKVRVEFNTDLQAQAKDLLNSAGLQAMQKDFAGLLDGTVSASDATKDFVAQLDAANTKYPISKDFIDKLTTSFEASNVAEGQNIALARVKATFGGEILKDMQDQIQALKLTNAQQDIYNKLQKAINDSHGMMADSTGKMVKVTQDYVNTLKQQLELQQKDIDLQQKIKDLHDNNGFRQWAADTQDANEKIQNLDKDTLTGLEDTLEKLGTTGRLSFKSMINSIQADLIKGSAQGITKNIANIFSPGSFDKNGNANQNGNPTLWGGKIGKSLFGTDGTDPSKSFTTDQKKGVDTNKMWQAVYDQATGSLKVILNGKTDSAAANSPVPPSSGPNGIPTQGGPQNLLPAGYAGANDNSALATAGTTPAAQQAGTAAATAFTQAMNPASNSIAANFKMALTSPLTFLTSQLSSAVSKLFSSSSSGGSGSGGLLSSLFGGSGGSSGMGDMSGGGSDVYGIASDDPGIYREGGISGFAAQHASSGAYNRLPHFSEGTPHTGNFAGGMPAILHQNEAIVPLSRGRSIPVQMPNGNDNGKSSGGNQSIVFNVTSPDADSFRRSQSQMATQAWGVGSKAARRNG